MHEDGLIDKLERPHVTLDYQWCLFQRPRIKALKLQNYEHEKTCADIFVPCQLRGVQWTYYPMEFKRHGLYPDRKFKYEGKTVYVEVDLSTEPLKTIEKKVRDYIKVYAMEPDHRFHVVFVVPDGDRAEQILGVLQAARKGNMFLLSLQDWMTTDPLTDVYVSPLDPSKRLSLTTL